MLLRNDWQNEELLLTDNAKSVRESDPGSMEHKRDSSRTRFSRIKATEKKITTRAPF